MSKRVLFVLLLMLVAIAAACTPAATPTPTSAPPTVEPTVEPTIEPTTAAEAVETEAAEAAATVEAAVTEAAEAVETEVAEVETEVAVAVAPTATEVPPTETPTDEPTATEVPPTATDVPPTETPTDEPTATDVPPTATDVPPTATDIPTATALPTEAPTEEAAVVVEATEVAEATGPQVVISAGDPIVLGSASGLSGDGIAPLGEDIRRGIELALAARSTVTVDGQSFDVILDAQDDLCSAEGGQAVANRFAADGNIVAVVGPMCSSACLAAAPIFDAAGYTTISPSCTNPRLTTSDFTSFNRAVASDAAQGVVAANFLYNNLGVRKIATIHDGSAYGEGLVAVVTSTFEALGGEVVKSDAISVGDTDFRGLLEDIAQDEPELIYFGGFPAEAARMAEQRADAGLEDVPMFAGDGILGTEFVELAGSSARDVYATSSVPTQSEALDAFLATYVETYGEQPPAPYHANAYDAANLFLDAVEAVGTIDADGNLVVDRAALSEYIRSVTGYEGLIGVLTNDGTGELVTSGEFTISQVQDGAFTAIATGAVADGVVTISPVDAMPEATPEATAEATPAS